MRNRTHVTDDRMAASSVTDSPRCTTRACPVIYASGPDRPCRDHRDEDTTTGRMAALGVTMTQVPGEHNSDDDTGKQVVP